MGFNSAFKGLKFPLFLPNLNLIFLLMSHYKIAPKFVQWEPCWYMQTYEEAWRKLMGAFGDYTNAPKQ